MSPTRAALAVLLPLALTLAALPSPAQPPAKTFRIGLLGDTPGPQWDAFRKGMTERGWVEGQSFSIEGRWSQGHNDRLPALASELVRLQMDLIVAEGSTATLVAKKATSTIPIVMAISADPVGTGVVASLARPGGNVTGMASPSPQLTAKQVELLKEVVPGLARLAVLWNPNQPAHRVAMKEIDATAVMLKIKVLPVQARSAGELDGALETIVLQGAGGLLVVANPTMDGRQAKIAEFAAKHRLPAIYNKPQFAEAGGLLSYGPRYADFFLGAAGYVDKILRGARPGELPVEQPVNFELIVNLKTAKALALTVPPAVLLRADQVIQ
jgi:putative ABC transport system substrate-binding protein